MLRVPQREFRRAAGIALIVVAALSALALGPSPGAQAVPIDGIHNIQHVVTIMQENRSFDNYFGTYPGANGIPAGVCLPSPLTGTCVRPWHNPGDKDYGGPHGSRSAIADIDGGLMDGFVASAENGLRCGGVEPNCSPCNEHEGLSCYDVVSYHDAREIPNYWTYAKDFVLQDAMFEPVASWSLPAHLELLSGWSASCPNNDPMECTSSLNPPGMKLQQRAWTDITYLLYKANVSWRYYLLEGSEPDCELDEAIACEPVKQRAATPSIWNQLPDATDVKEDSQVGNVQSLSNFYTAVHKTGECGLPNVSWLVPNQAVSEHPPALISNGQAYVTTAINAIMRSPCWDRTAIFLSWDDWGGFYDHVVPPVIDTNGYGLRVPGLLISPYAKTGYIDHQQLSHDAYLRFIEDDFLGGARLNPRTDGRPDSRPDVREEAPGLGNLVNDFNFNQQPRAPVILSPHPAPGPASTPPAP